MAKNKRFLFATDLHGDMQDKSAVNALFKFIDLWKPDIRVFGGDLWDLRPLRRGASDDEKRESMRADFYAGANFLKRFRPHYFLRGNHDERLWELRERDNGVASDYAGELIGQIERELRAMKCQMLPYHKRDGVLRLGHLKMLHGFSCGITATRQTALIYGASLMGHVHTIDEHAIPGLDRRVCRAVGALCRLDMEYNSRQPQSLRHAHGWAFGVILPSGEYVVHQAEEIGGKWIVPCDVREL